MDKLKIGVTKLTILMERQLNYLLNAKLNDKFPPFLNRGKLGFNFGLQGMQFTAVSTTAENQTLSNPMSVHSISNNGDNQDIVSMGTNAALLTKKVIDNSLDVLAIHLVAIAQAMDISDNFSAFSSSAKELYKFVRQDVPELTEDVSLNTNLEQLKKRLLTTQID
jgi:histidine ammonia-lyase